jgi:hypothetical protein
LSAAEDRVIHALVRNLIPLVKRLIVTSLDQPLGSLEQELATLADLYVIEDHLST